MLLDAAARSGCRDLCTRQARAVPRCALVRGWLSDRCSRRGLRGELPRDHGLGRRVVIDDDKVRPLEPFQCVQITSPSTIALRISVG
jgi:hypothetical protein